MARVGALRDLVLVAVGALKQTHGRDGGEQPGELVHLRHIALAEEHRFRGIEAAGEEGGRGVEGVLAQRGGVGERRERVVIGDEIEGLALLGQLNRGLDRAKVVAEVQRAGGLNAR